MSQCNRTIHLDIPRELYSHNLYFYRVEKGKKMKSSSRVSPYRSASFQVSYNRVPLSGVPQKNSYFQCLSEKWLPEVPLFPLLPADLSWGIQDR